MARAAAEPTHREVEIESAGARLRGDLARAEGAAGIVLFAHGSGSGRRSPRNRFVAERLHDYGLATLLLDLLSEEEEQEDRWSAKLRFDIGLLARRLTGAADWVAGNRDTSGLALGLFGASTGAAAALVTASERPGEVGAVVSRGGRPDLALDALPHVAAPTLLIVGGADFEVLDLNREALEQLGCEKQLAIVPGATHLFEEPGALEEVTRLAGEWFESRLSRRER